jgi:alpha/beta superfamily hydrolase
MAVAAAIDSYPVEGAAEVAVILHPHPDYGGDRHNHVVDALYRGLGINTARFDFSSSDPDAAKQEAEMVIDEVAVRVPHETLYLIGYSFGADIAATVDDRRIAGWCLVAPPLRMSPPEAMAIAADERPKLLLVAEHDQFGTPERARAVTDGWRATTIEVVPGDHFQSGGATSVVDRARAWVKG